MAKIGIWTERSLSLANRNNYLDQLYRVYPARINMPRILPAAVTDQIKECFVARDSQNLLRLLLKLELFPVKDSYVAYLRHDIAALTRNPLTCSRIAGMIYEMGLDCVLEKAREPKENNRQMGPLFKNWVGSGALGALLTDDFDVLLRENNPVVFVGTDGRMREFASDYLGYSNDKGLDFLAKFNNRYVIAEAKFLTDFGGHQNAQLNDAISLLESPLNRTSNSVIQIAILDGVLYIQSRNKMHLQLLNYARDYPIMSALLLRDFLYTL